MLAEKLAALELLLDLLVALLGEPGLELGLDVGVDVHLQRLSGHVDHHDSLSSKVIKQKRIFYTIFMLIGDVGGMNDFLVLQANILFGFFSSKLMYASIIEKIFHASARQGYGAEADDVHERPQIV